MELKYVLDSIIHKEKADGNTWTFVYKPTLDEYGQVCSFTIKTSVPYEVLKKLNLPKTIGDIIVMEFKPKNVQESLKKK